VPTPPRRRRAISGADRGTATVEFALVLPLLLVMCLALVQVGLLARDRLLVEAVARAGAREAALQADQAAIRAAALAAGPGLEPEAVTIGVTRAGSVGDPVTVEVTYAEPIRVPFVDWLFGATVTMATSATDRQEFAS
jgi:Flp pilus assembly protein TadG